LSVVAFGCWTIRGQAKSRSAN